MVETSLLGQWHRDTQKPFVATFPRVCPLGGGHTNVISAAIKEGGSAYRAVDNREVDHDGLDAIGFVFRITEGWRGVVSENTEAYGEATKGGGGVG